MSADQFDELLKKMPGIAKAVNSFTSEAVQQKAFTALVRTIGVDVQDENDTDGDEADTEVHTPAKRVRKRPAAAKKPAKKPAKKAAAATKKKATAANPKMVNDLNLRPNGKDSFKKFATDRAPKSQDEKNAVIVYYLKEVLKVEKVTADHVFTAYREMKDEGWKTPGNVRNSLQVTKSLKGWVVTSDMDDITMSIAGTNMVEHDLPKKPTKK